MQVRAAHAAKIRIIRGEKKKTHSSAFVKFEIFVFKKLRDSCAPSYLGSAELISSHRQRVADVTPHSDEVDKKTP